MDVSTTGILTIAERRLGLMLCPIFAELFEHSASFCRFAYPPGASQAPHGGLILRLLGHPTAEHLYNGRAHELEFASIKTWRPLLDCDGVAERLAAREPGDLTLERWTFIDIFHRATRTLECFQMRSPRMSFEDASEILHGRLLRLLMALLASDRGLMLHGAGVVISGAAGAIVGPSGAGKTTASRLILADRLLSDDSLAVTHIGEGPRLHATPFGRETDGPASAPLRAIFLPRKGERFTLRPIPARQALRELLEEQADRMQSMFREHANLAIRHCFTLLREVPAYELCFSMKEGIPRDAIAEVLLRG